MEHPLIWIGLGLLILLLLSATTNFALVSPSKVRVFEMLKKTGRKEQFARLVRNRADLLFATATLRSLSSLGVLTCLLAMATPSSDAVVTGGMVASLGIAFVAVVVFGVALPAALARYSGERVLLVALPLLLLMHTVMYPLALVRRGADWIVRRLAGIPNADADDQADEFERELLTAVSEGEIRGAVDEEEKEMIESVIDLRDTDVGAIMTPRTDIIAIDKNAGLAEVREAVVRAGFSRYPVYDGTIDTILGVLYAKDLLRLDADSSIDATGIMREASFIPETKQLRELLHEFQDKKVHIAIVLDEYGGTSGLVTIEDILEELVGEIVDEYEKEEPEAIARLDDRTFEVDARTRIDELNHALMLDLPESPDYETIGGFVLSALGRIPKEGEQCTHENVEIRVIAAEPRKINRVRVQLVPDDGNPLEV